MTIDQSTKNECRFDVRLAQDENEIRAAQRLRYQVFRKKWVRAPIHGN